MLYVKVPSHAPEVANRNYKKPQSRFKVGTSYIQSESLSPKSNCLLGLILEDLRLFTCLFGIPVAETYN